MILGPRSPAGLERALLCRAGLGDEAAVGASPHARALIFEFNSAPLWRKVRGETGKTNVGKAQNAMSETASAAAREPRRGREARRTARAHRSHASIPYITRKIPLTELISEEGLATIERNAETLLQEIGIEFRDFPRALDLFRNAGCDIKGERVRFPRGLARQLCATTPSQYVQHARNPERNVVIGGDAMVFAPNYGSPFVHDLDKGRRYGTLEDFQNFVKLSYMSPYIHHSGGTVCEPVDLPVNKRHFEMVYAHLKYSDKPFMGSVTKPERAEDSVRICELLFGEDFVRDNTVLTSLINANSPLVWDSSMLGAAEAYAKANQACIITPFILSGAMSPVTVAGTLTQVLAEVLAGTAFCQLTRPGAPVVFGTFVSTLSMQSGAPTFGTPEAALAIFGAGQLARRMNMPFRTGGSLCAPTWKRCRKLRDQACRACSSTSAAMAGSQPNLRDSGHSAPTQSERMRQKTQLPGAARAIFSTSARQSTAKRRTPSA